MASSSGCVWEAIGPARDCFEEISNSIQELLENSSDYLDEGEEISPTFSYGLWMIGRDPSYAVPTVILGCQKRTIRKRAETLIKQSGLLDRFPGMTLKTSSTTPQPLAKGERFPHLDDQADATTIYTIGNPHRSCGTHIILGQSGKMPSLSARKATLGGIIQIDGEDFGLTVAHAMDVASTKYIQDEELTGYIQFDSDTESQTESVMGGTSKGSLSPPSDTLSSNLGSLENLAESPTDTDSAPCNELNHLEPQELGAGINQASAQDFIKVGALAASSGEPNGYRQDWALFEMDRVYPRDGNEILIPKSDANNREKIYPRIVAAQMTDGEAIVVTGDSAAVKGRLFRTPILMRMPGNSVFQKVWPIGLATALAAGDCGAWVVNPQNGDLYGHLVAGNPSTRLAYIASAKDLFEDIYSRFYGEEILPQQPFRIAELAKGILTLTLTGIWGLGTGSRPFVIATFGHSEVILARPEAAGFDDSAVTDRRGLRVKFDVTNGAQELTVSLYDEAADDAFLGQVRLRPVLVEGILAASSGWHLLKDQSARPKQGSGEVSLLLEFESRKDVKVDRSDFGITNLLGKGTFGWRDIWNAKRITFSIGIHKQVYQVKKKDTGCIYAMKVFSKNHLADTRLKLEDLLRDQKRLPYCAFFADLRFCFEDALGIHCVTDFLADGQLFQDYLREGRFQEDRGRFYVSEIILALQYLQEQGIVSVGLRPEIIMLDGTGHIVLSNFGVFTKARGSGIFIQDTAYTAPEMVLDEQAPHRTTEYWALGIITFETLCGWKPFQADNIQEVDEAISFAKEYLPRDALSPEWSDFVEGLLTKNPEQRLGANRGLKELMDNPWFSDTDWDALAQRDVAPPFRPSFRHRLETQNLTGGTTLDFGSTPAEQSVIDQQFIDKAFGEQSAGSAVQGHSTSHQSHSAYSSGPSKRNHSQTDLSSINIESSDQSKRVRQSQNQSQVPRATSTHSFDEINIYTCCQCSEAGPQVWETNRKCSGCNHIACTDCTWHRHKP